MPRIRTIKPELPQDEVLGQCSREARLTFLLLLTQSDDFGRFRAHPVGLKGAIFPYDDITGAQVAEWLAELVEVGRLELYTVDGQSYGCFVNWSKHQRVDNASTKTALPAPPGKSESTPAGDAAEESESPPPAATVGNSPQLAATRGGPPLDQDLDPDLDQDHDDDRLAGVAAAYADLALERAVNVSSSSSFKRGVLRNFHKEHRKAALRIISRHPEATDEQLAEWLIAGKDPETADETSARYEAERRAIA